MSIAVRHLVKQACQAWHVQKTPAKKRFCTRAISLVVAAAWDRGTPCEIFPLIAARVINTRSALGHSQFSNSPPCRLGCIDGSHAVGDSLLYRVYRGISSVRPCARSSDECLLQNRNMFALLNDSDEEGEDGAAKPAATKDAPPKAEAPKKALTENKARPEDKKKVPTKTKVHPILPIPSLRSLSGRYLRVPCDA